MDHFSLPSGARKGPAFRAPNSLLPHMTAQAAPQVRARPGSIGHLIESADRDLPHDVEAERLVITALCVALDRQPHLELLQPEDFSDPFQRLIFQLLRSGQDVPTTMVQRKEIIRQRCGVDCAPVEFARLFLRRDGESQCGLVVNLPHYIKRVKELSCCRQGIMAAEHSLFSAWMEAEAIERG